MSFYGSSFIFDGKSSELYDLRLFEFEPSNPSESFAGGTASIKEEWLYRREVPYYYGRFYESTLEFDFTVGSFSAIDGSSRHAIETWLLGRATYLPLRIVQDDISDVMFNVILSQSTHHYIGNLAYALTLHARCDRPWGIYNPPTYGRTYTGGFVSGETFNYFNASAYSGYNKPNLSITMGLTGGYFSLVNHTDNEREFRFDDLYPNETVTVDNDRGIITSSTGLFRMANFNKKFFRTVQGINNITISGYPLSFSLDTTFARGVGA